MNFITITNSGYDFFCDSQIENFSLDFMGSHKLTIYCADENSFSRLSSRIFPINIEIKKIEGQNITGNHSYLEGRFKELMKLKFPIILNRLKENKDDIWFVDNDVLFLKSPSQEDIDPNKDVIFQADMGEFEHMNSWVCTGCFYLKNNERTINFLEKIIEYQDSVDRGEQEALNDYCKSWPDNGPFSPDVVGSILDFKEANLGVLPFYLYQNGRLAFFYDQYNKHDCVMIHFNHEKDFSKKIENFKKTKNYYFKK
jgi:hypothetical protein